MQRTALVLVATILSASTASTLAAGLVSYDIVDGRSIPDPLTGAPGDPVRGKAIAADRKLGNCLACHVIPALRDEPFHGNVGPSLAGVSNRLKEGELRLWVVDPKIVAPDTMMPAFYRSEGLYRVIDEFQGQPILSAEQIEDVVALLMTLQGEETAGSTVRPPDQAPEVVKVDPPPDSDLTELISGYYFGIQETRAMQDDDLFNPGSLWVELGAELWGQAEGEAQKSCARCHGAAEDSMRGVGAAYPKYKQGAGKVLNLEQQVNRCRSERMQAQPWPFGSDELLAMTIFVKHQSRGMPVNVAIDGPAAPFFEQGKASFYRRRGLLDMTCAHCHDQNYGKMLRGDWLSQGHTNGYPIYALGDASARHLHKLLWHCNELMRSTPFDVLSDEFVNLELFLAWRGSRLPVETPGVRW